MAMATGSALKVALTEGLAQDSRRNVIALYRAWYRQIPYIVETFNLDKTVKECRQTLRERFVRNSNDDPAVVDRLVAKGTMELEETVNVWKQKTHVMRFFEDPSGPKPEQDFMTRFLNSYN
eukprot:m.478540 g.478540  ORF g.478540 m.478540 type:complete len:121 (-) comp21160_c0_seq1:99-461(-)